MAMSPKDLTGFSSSRAPCACAQGVLDRGGAEWQDKKLRQARSCAPYAPGCEIAISSPCAEVAELADALHSGCSSRQGVEVRVLSSAYQPLLSIIYTLMLNIIFCTKHYLTRSDLPSS